MKPAAKADRSSALTEARTVTSGVSPYSKVLSTAGVHYGRLCGIHVIVKAELPFSGRQSIQSRFHYSLALPGESHGGFPISERRFMGSEGR